MTNMAAELSYSPVDVRIPTAYSRRMCHCLRRPRYLARFIGSFYAFSLSLEIPQHIFSCASNVDLLATRFSADVAATEILILVDTLVEPCKSWPMRRSLHQLGVQVRQPAWPSTLSNHSGYVNKAFVGCAYSRDGLMVPFVHSGHRCLLFVSLIQAPSSTAACHAWPPAQATGQHPAAHDRTRP